jgi:hypothetical protein
MIHMYEVLFWEIRKFAYGRDLVSRKVIKSVSRDFDVGYYFFLIRSL